MTETVRIVLCIPSLRAPQGRGRGPCSTANVLPACTPTRQEQTTHVSCVLQTVFRHMVRRLLKNVIASPDLINFHLETVLPVRQIVILNQTPRDWKTASVMPATFLCLTDLVMCARHAPRILIPHGGVNRYMIAFARLDSSDRMAVSKHSVPARSHTRVHTLLFLSHPRPIPLHRVLMRFLISGPAAAGERVAALPATRWGVCCPLNVPV